MDVTETHNKINSITDCKIINVLDSLMDILPLLIMNKPR